MHVSGQRQQLKRRNLSTVFNVNLPTKTASECLKWKTKAFGVVKVFNMYGMLLSFITTPLKTDTQVADFKYS